MNGFLLKANSGWQDRREPERVIYCNQSVARLLVTVLASLLIALRVYAQTSVSSSPGAAQSVPAPAAAASRGEAAISVAELAQKPEMVTRLEIFLDQRSFSPGKIDGRLNDFCAKALQRYQLAQGQPVTGKLDPTILQEMKQISPLYVSYELKADDFRHVGRAPRRPVEQSRVKSMPYRSILEFLAERYHSDERFLRSLNAGRNMNALKPGDQIRVPNVTPFQIETLHPVENLPPNPALAARTIKVDTQSRELDVMEGDKIIGSFPVTPGSRELPAPIGTWKIVRVTLMPWFRWDREMLNHGKRSSNFRNIPPGPRNPVGIAWIGLDKKGIGIHGTDNPEMIGHSASHGCIRLANWDVDRVSKEVSDGAAVQIF
jgi:lipoprotein-anchoring transpeptidase ErfK/SrfK